MTEHTNTDDSTHTGQVKKARGKDLFHSALAAAPYVWGLVVEAISASHYMHQGCSLGQSIVAASPKALAYAATPLLIIYSVKENLGLARTGIMSAACALIMADGDMASDSIARKFHDQKADVGKSRTISIQPAQPETASFIPDNAIYYPKPAYTR